MKRADFFLDLIEGYLKGALDRRGIWQFVAAELPPKNLRENETDLVRSCEWALRHVMGRGPCTSDRELRYLAQCLRKQRPFKPAERDQIRNRPPPPVRLPVAQGVFAIVIPHTFCWGLRLIVQRRALEKVLFALEAHPEFRELLEWHQIHVGKSGGQFYYIVRRARLSRFLLELRTFLDSHFSAALAD